MKQRLALAVVLGTIFAAAPLSPARADVIRDDEWHLRYLNVTEANQKTRGEGVTVAIVDRGVDRLHQDLTGAVLDPVFVPRGAGNPGPQPSLSTSPLPQPDQPVDGTDADGHGTALAGALAGQGHGDDHGDGVVGVAPGAKVLPVVLATPSERPPTADELADGIDAAVTDRAAVILVGWSVAGSERLKESVRKAQAADAIIVAADGDQPGRSFEPYPAAYDGVLAAVPLSRTGDTLVESASGRKLGLGVPGFQIMTTNTGNRYRIDDGSAAPALLAGAVALLRSAHSDERSADIVRRLTLTAVDTGAKGPDPLNGLGRLDLVPALNRRLPPPSPSAAPSVSKASGVSPSATPIALPAVPRSRGQYGWLLGLPLLLVIAGVAWYAGRAERRVRQSGRNAVDSVRAQS